MQWTMSNAHRASIASFPRSAKEKSGGVNKSPDFKAHVQQKHEIGFNSYVLHTNDSDRIFIIGGVLQKILPFEYQNQKK